MPLRDIRQRLVDGASFMLVQPLPRMVTVFVCLAFGVFFVDVRVIWQLPWFAASVAILAAAGCWLAARHSSSSRTISLLLLLCALAALAGGARNWWSATPQSSTHLLYHLPKGRVELHGLVVTPPTQQRRAVSLLVEAERLIYPDQERPGQEGLRRAKIGRDGPRRTKMSPDGRPTIEKIVSGRVLIKVYESWPYVRYGDRIAVRNVVLKRPYRYNNPGEFDYRRYLESQGIFVRAGVSSWLRVDILQRDQGTWLGAVLSRAKRRMGTLLDWQVGEPAASVLRALLLGERGRLKRTRVEQFTESGIAHLLAVSGLHIGFVALACFAVLRFLFALVNGWLIATWAYCVSPRRAAAFLAIWPTLLYAMLVGSRVSTVRATIMALTYLGAIAIDRQRSVFHALFLAGSAILLWMPGSLYQAGFYLSFVAALGIALAVAYWQRREAADPFLKAGLEKRSLWRRRMILMGLVTTTAWLVTMPIIAYTFGAIHPWGILTNFVAVPLATIAVPSGLLGLGLGLLWSPLAVAPLHVSALLVKILLAVSGVIQALPGATLNVVTPPLTALLLAYLALGLLGLGLCALGGPRRILLWGGLAALLATLVAALPPYLPRGERDALRVAFLNVGQGDAAVVELPDGRVMLIDAGNRWPSGFDAGAMMVAPYLRHRGIRRVDIAVATHRDSDHLGGLPYIIRRYGVGEVWTNSIEVRNYATYELDQAMRHTGTLRRVLREGARIDLGADTYVEVMNPGGSFPAHDDWRLRSENNHSLVLRLVYKGTSVLFTGDIERLTEQRLLASGARLTSTILKAPHHGSRSSSSAAFLDAVQPLAAIASAGYYNRYRHPASQVARRYLKRGIPLYTTATNGAVIVESDGVTMRVAPRVPHDATPPILAPAIPPRKSLLVAER